MPIDKDTTSPIHPHFIWPEVPAVAGYDMEDWIGPAGPLTNPQCVPKTWFLTFDFGWLLQMRFMQDLWMSYQLWKIARHDRFHQVSSPAWVRSADPPALPHRQRAPTICINLWGRCHTLQPLKMRIGLIDMERYGMVKDMKWYRSSAVCLRSLVPTCLLPKCDKIWPLSGWWTEGAPRSATSWLSTSQRNDPPTTPWASCCKASLQWKQSRFQIHSIIMYNQYNFSIIIYNAQENHQCHDQLYQRTSSLPRRWCSSGLLSRDARPWGWNLSRVTCTAALPRRILCCWAIHQRLVVPAGFWGASVLRLEGDQQCCSSHQVSGFLFIMLWPWQTLQKVTPSLTFEIHHQHSSTTGGTITWNYGCPRLHLV